MKKSKFLVLGMLGTIFSCCAAPCGACISSFATTQTVSKGFALLPFKNGVDIAAVEGVAVSIDRHGVPKGQGCPCRDPRTGGGVLAPRRDIRGSKN